MFKRKGGKKADEHERERWEAKHMNILRVQACASPSLSYHNILSISQIYITGCTVVNFF